MAARDPFDELDDLKFETSLAICDRCSDILYIMYVLASVPLSKLGSFKPEGVAENDGATGDA